MPNYIMCANWTEKGIQNIKESPERLEAAKKAVEAAGGRMIAFYVTMGRYDMVSIGEFPDDDAAAAVVLSLGRGGNLRSETLKAFTEDEYKGIIAKLP